MSLVAQTSRIQDFLAHLEPTSQQTLTAYSVTKDMDFFSSDGGCYDLVYWLEDGTLTEVDNIEQFGNV